MTAHAQIAANVAAQPIASLCLVERESLLGALDHACKIVERRNTIPILSNVAISACEAGGLRIVGTDLDMQCEFTIEAAWEAPGSYTVAAEALRDMVKKLPKGAHITLSHDPDAHRLTVSAGRLVSTLATLPCDDFPAIAFEETDAHRFDMPSDIFCRDLVALAPAMSKEETRYYLNGIALQLGEPEAEQRLYMIATDGAQMVRIARPVPAGAEAIADTILPRKVATLLSRFLKKAEPAALAFELQGDLRARIAGQGWRLTTKMIDGTFPNWRGAHAAALGQGELQHVAMIELDPRLAVANIAKLAKAAGADLRAETGEKAAMLTCADYPEYLALSTFNNPDARNPFQINGAEFARDNAARYLVALRDAAGLPDLEPAGLSSHADGGFAGMTFGTSERVEQEPVERVCYETFTSTVEYPEALRIYEDGAYSVPMPHAQAYSVTAEINGNGAQPVRTNIKGEIEFSAAAVADMVGDPACFDRVEIPTLQFLHGRAVTGYYFPARPRVSTGQTNGRRMRPMTDREMMAAYCRDPAGFLASVRAYPRDAALAAVDVASVARGIADIEPIADEERFEAAPVQPAVPETNVIAVDFAAAAAERDQREIAEELEAAYGQDDLASRIGRLEYLVESFLARPVAVEPDTGDFQPAPAAPSMDAPPASMDGAIAPAVDADELAQLRAKLATVEAERDALCLKVTSLQAGQESLEAVLKVKSDHYDILALAMDRAREEMADVRQRADDNLAQAEEQAARAVEATKALRIAEADLKRLAPLASALATYSPPPPAVPVPLILDHRGERLVSTR